MKYVITINQEKLLKLAPAATLSEGAILDFLFHFCSSVSPAVERNRMTGPDGRRYTWIDYGTVISELPLLGVTTKKAVVRLMRNVEAWGFIRTISPDHQRKFVAITEKFDRLSSSGDKQKLWPKGNRAVSDGQQLPGQSYVRTATYPGTTEPDTRNLSRTGVHKYRKSDRINTGIERIGSIIRRRP